MKSSRIFQTLLNSSLLPLAFFFEGISSSEASPLIALDLITTV